MTTNGSLNGQWSFAENQTAFDMPMHSLILGWKSMLYSIQIQINETANQAFGVYWYHRFTGIIRKQR